MPVSHQGGGGYTHYECGSVAYKDGAFWQELMCSQLAASDDFIESLMAACDKFREAVLHGVGCGLDNDQTNAVLDLFDEVIGSKYE